MHWYLEALRKFSDFETRSRRTEFWSYMLINCVGGALFGLATVRWSATHPSLWTNVLAGVLALIASVPGIAVTVRRLHDTNHSGSWVLLYGVPLVGSTVLLIFTLRDSDVGENDYGPSPKLELMTNYTR